MDVQWKRVGIQQQLSEKEGKLEKEQGGKIEYKYLHFSKQ